MAGSSNQIPKIPVELRLSDGEEIFGEVRGGVSNNLESALNTDKRFITVTCEDGSTRLVALAAIVVASQKQPLRQPELKRPQLATEETALSLLGLNADFTAEQLKESYHHRVKIYHPDKFVQTELPREVVDYAGEMFRQVNAAHEILKRKLNFKLKFGHAA